MNFGLELSGIAWINKLKLILRTLDESENVMNLLDVGNFRSISWRDFHCFIGFKTIVDPYGEAWLLGE